MTATVAASTTATATVQMHPNKANFVEGVRLIFDSWTALRLAVQMEFSGIDTQEKAQWLQSVVVDHFDVEGKRVEPEDLEDILIDVMTREFHVALEDGSEREIAAMLCSLFRQSIRGETKMLSTLREQARARAARGDSTLQSLSVNQVQEVDDDGSSDDSCDGSDVDMQ